MKKAGFTLVEMVVVVGVTGIIMAAITGVLLNSFKAKNRVNVADLVEQNGSMLISELRKNVVNGVLSTCVNGNKVTVSNKADQKDTEIECASSKIASKSAANTVYLNGSNVIVSDCDTFVECFNVGGKTTKIVFAFTLSGGSQIAGPANFVKKTFVTEVATRD
ncbi:MAG: prepilin-type N-terminal cleavage/methylation domain-containing protein [Candidatus Shapirobacteria bacterium]